MIFFVQVKVLLIYLLFLIKVLYEPLHSSYIVWSCLFIHW